MKYLFCPPHQLSGGFIEKEQECLDDSEILQAIAHIVGTFDMLEVPRIKFVYKDQLVYSTYIPKI